MVPPKEIDWFNGPVTKFAMFIAGTVACTALVSYLVLFIGPMIERATFNAETVMADAIGLTLLLLFSFILMIIITALSVLVNLITAGPIWWLTGWMSRKFRASISITRSIQAFTTTIYGNVLHYFSFNELFGVEGEDTDVFLIALFLTTSLICAQVLVQLIYRTTL